MGEDRFQAPYESTPDPQELVAGRGILDLSTLDPEIIQLLISIGVLDQNGMPVSGAMNVMREGAPQGAEMGAAPEDPRTLALQRMLAGAGKPQAPGMGGM